MEEHGNSSYLVTPLNASTVFYCSINGKIKKEPENPWIRYKCGKKRAIPHFSVASSKFCGKLWILQYGMKIHVPQKTAGPGYKLVGTLSETHSVKSQQSEHHLKQVSTVKSFLWRCAAGISRRRCRLFHVFRVSLGPVQPAAFVVKDAVTSPATDVHETDYTQFTNTATTVFLAQHDSMVTACCLQVRNTVIIQCFDAVGWVTGRASGL